MSKVEASLKRLINTQGPITLAQFMSDALLHPDGGYYTNATVFGADGDFTTAPEISQVFGELIGLWAADYWHRLGAPTPFKLIELGPGRGTLMADALRAAKALPGFLQAAELHLVDASPQLRDIQKRRLQDAAIQPVWHDRLSDVPDGPAIIIANEFFDALPIRQYQFLNGTWCERRIGINTDDQFAFTPAAGAPPPNSLPKAPPADGDILEICAPALAVLKDMTDRLNAHGGAALMIDYGYAQPAYGDTFQAVKAHDYTNPLIAPGTADLTAHVNFGLLAQAATETGAMAHGPVTQGDFLQRLGITPRTQQLLANATPAQQQSLTAASQRLVAADEMGTIFKVMALTAQDAPQPAGFEGDV